MTDYAEHDGIWHIAADDKTACGRDLESEPQRLDFEPKPLCWRCREAT